MSAACAWTPSRLTPGRGRLVLVEMPRRQRERVASERVAQLARDHYLQHGRPSLALRSDRGAQGRAHVREPLHALPIGAHRAGNRSPRRLPVQVDADEAAIVEVDVVLLLCAPLAVVEYDRGHGNALAHTGLQLAE